MGSQIQISLRVFCDFHPAEQDDGPDRSEFVGQSNTEVYRLAREAGWHFYMQQGKAKCGKCYAAQKAKSAA